MSNNRQGDFLNPRGTTGSDDSDSYGDEFSDHFDLDQPSADDSAADQDEEDFDGENYAEEEDYAEDEHEDFDLSADRSDFELVENADDLLDLDHPPVTESQITTAARPRRRHRQSRQAIPTGRGGAAMVFAGGLMMTAGFALAIATITAPARLQPVIDNLGDVGLSPGLMVTLGVVLALVAQLTTRIQVFQGQMVEYVESARESNDLTGTNLEFLVDAQEQSDARRPASGEELDQVLMTLTRQDEKINNLTKALKMYGKPLVEVSRHVAEVAARTKSANSDLSALKQAVQSGLDKTTHKIIDDVASIVADIPTDNGADEVVKSVSNLDARMQRELAQLSSNQADSSVFVDEARAIGSQLTKEITQLLDSQGDRQDSAGLSALRADMGALQEAVKGLTSAVSSSESSRAQAPAPQPAMATAATAPTPVTPTPVAQTPVAPTTAATPSPAPAAGKSKGGPGGLANSISGKTKTEGKGVLSAIAKLKKMR